jgi:uncharacterized protein (TIGR03492 family)
MTQALDVLLVSNGYGEAAIAGYIARALAAKAADAKIEHVALVGRGTRDAWPPRVGPVAELPSGGLVANWHVRNLVRDIGAGLLGLLVRQYRFLRAQRQRSVVIAVGDVFCLMMALLARRPTVFVATAKSDYVAPHSGVERRIACKAAVTFARDEQTARELESAGVNARYAGNVMMDGIDPAGVDLRVDSGALRVAILPGSRSDAPRQAAAMVERLRLVARRLGEKGKHIQAYVSVASSVDERALICGIQSTGFSLQDAQANAVTLARGSESGLEVTVVRGAFGDLLEAAQLVLGQAGTANEQAAGCGKPVIAALEPTERASRMQWYRMRQKRLLGEALAVFPASPDQFADELVNLLDDPGRLEAMGRAGRERMGGPGGAAAVADAVIALANAS